MADNAGRATAAAPMSILVENPRFFFAVTRPLLRPRPIQPMFQEADMQILVVEDHADTRNVLSGLLTRWGYDVSPVETLKGGLDRLNTEPSVDVIVSDIALPDGTGYALVSEARRTGKRILAIALSGYAYPSDVRVAKLTGFDYHLSKPCDCHHLRSILQDRARWEKDPIGKD